MNNKNGRKPINHLLHHPDWSAASLVGTPRITLCWVDYKIPKQTIQNTDIKYKIHERNTKYMNEIQNTNINYKKQPHNILDIKTQTKAK